MLARGEAGRRSTIGVTSTRVKGRCSGHPNPYDWHVGERIWNRWPVWRGLLGITIVYALLTAFLTWPQLPLIKTHAFEHQDVFFNLWRLRWLAHALVTSPLQLFDANVFHPERGVLAFSDAMLVEGLLGAPLLWAGLPPVLVHNLLLLGAIVGSALAIFVLARHLTGSAAAATVAGVVFAFAPYRFAHYMHMELQWTVWSPLAFWALQRTIETGSLRFGLLMGLFVTLQMASCIYYGVFLFILIGAVGSVQLIPLRGRAFMRAAGALLLGGGLAASMSWAYSLPYSAAAARVGTRSHQEVQSFSARPRDYAFATPTNLLYGSPDRDPSERQLFPGILPPLLAVVGLLLVPPTTEAIAYLIGLVVAFELSLGVYGQLYPFLYAHLGVLHGLRATARASAFVLLFLGVLAAQGTAALARARPRLVGPGLAALLCALILVEYRVAPMPLVPYPNEAPPLYKFLASLPRGNVIEFPIPKPDAVPRHDPRFEYMSTFHWMPLLNGYSGFYPRSYLLRLARLKRFPDEESVASLRREHVRYVIVHEDGYPAGERIRIIERLQRLNLTHVADFEDGWGIGTIMELQ